MFLAISNLAFACSISKWMRRIVLGCLLLIWDIVAAISLLLRHILLRRLLLLLRWETFTLIVILMEAALGLLYAILHGPAARFRLVMSLVMNVLRFYLLYWDLRDRSGVLLATSCHPSTESISSLFFCIFERFVLLCCAWGRISLLEISWLQFQFKSATLWKFTATSSWAIAWISESITQFTIWSIQIGIGRWITQVSSANSSIWLNIHFVLLLALICFLCLLRLGERPNSSIKSCRLWSTIILRLSRSFWALDHFDWENLFLLLASTFILRIILVVMCLVLKVLIFKSIVFGCLYSGHSQLVLLTEISNLQCIVLLRIQFLGLLFHFLSF